MGNRWNENRRASMWSILHYFFSLYCSSYWPPFRHSSCDALSTRELTQRSKTMSEKEEQCTQFSTLGSFSIHAWSAFFREPWFFFELNTIRLPKPKQEFGPLLDLWPNDLTHEATVRYEGHITHWGQVTSCSVHTLFGYGPTSWVLSAPLCHRCPWAYSQTFHTPPAVVSKSGFSYLP